MHVHILGICGTFMGGIAQLAKALGHKVTGSDANIYPPMSTQLAATGIELHSGYEPTPLDPPPDTVIIGNALTRGNPSVEYILNKGLHYTSGPQWLADNVLLGRWVLAVAGTHGKTTTASILAWILEYAGLNPGFLIGGVPKNFTASARLGDFQYFVVEADEYDTAFFDKRSKFVHYHPKTLVLNNLEMDHADIFDNLEQIQRQFHHLVRTIPANGKIIYPLADIALQQVLDMGCWTPTETLAISIDNIATDEIATWQISDASPDGRTFKVLAFEKPIGTINWQHTGQHNMANALAALAAAYQVGIAPGVAIEALDNFKGVRRRMETYGCINNITVYDDFAHHPTAIHTSIAGLRAHKPNSRILAVLELRSNTMRLGTHGEQLAMALDAADQVYIYTPPELNWDVATTLNSLKDRLHTYPQVTEIIEALVVQARSGDSILIMSNGGFENIQQRLLDTL